MDSLHDLVDDRIKFMYGDMIKHKNKPKVLLCKSLSCDKEFYKSFKHVIPKPKSYNICSFK